MIMELLQAGKIEEHIDKTFSIALKPNLVVAKSSRSGATTTPDIAAGVIEYLRDHGYNDITIMESAWLACLTRDAFKAAGYDRICKKYDIPFLDLKDDTLANVRVKDLDLTVCESAKNIDFMINMPVLKGHCQTRMTCALKNMKGCIPDSEKRRYHNLGLHRPIAYLNKALKQDLVIVDGIMGDLTFEEGGTPVNMDRIIIGRDPVLVDSYVCELMGLSPHEVEYISIAESLGIGSTNLDNAVIKEFGDENKKKTLNHSSNVVANLKRYIKEKDACSACYGSLIHALHRLDEKGLLGKLQNKVYIGQGYKKTELEGIGIGSCTAYLTSTLPGCPPRAVDILKFLEDEL